MLYCLSIIVDKMALNLIINLFLVFCAFSNVSSQSLSSRIVNGNIDTLNQFPWYASIHITYNNNPTVNYCGGSIISNNFILTSAECIHNAKSIKINLGSTSFSKPAKSLQSTIYFIHPNFNLQTFQNNIALIKLPSPLVYTATMSPIHLIAKNQINQLYLNSEAYIAGFGYISTNNKTMSERLQWVKQRVISNQECLHHFTPAMIQTGQQLCTVGWDGPWQSVCFGDGGGALAINDYGIWTQIAVMSFIHVNGCQDARPTGYTRISPYVDWISKTAAYSFRL